MSHDKNALLNHKTRVRPWFDMAPRTTSPQPVINLEEIQELKTALELQKPKLKPDIYIELKEELEALKTVVAHIPGASGVPGRTKTPDNETIILVRKEQDQTVQLRGVDFGMELKQRLQTIKKTIETEE